MAEDIVVTKSHAVFAGALYRVRFGDDVTSLQQDLDDGVVVPMSCQHERRYVGSERVRLPHVVSRSNFRLWKGRVVMPEG